MILGLYIVTKDFRFTDNIELIPLCLVTLSLSYIFPRVAAVLYKEFSDADAVFAVTPRVIDSITLEKFLEYHLCFIGVRDRNMYISFILIPDSKHLGKESEAKSPY